MGKTCKKCGLSSKCESPFLFRKELSFKKFKERRGGILVVGNYPTFLDEEKGYFFQDEAGKFLRRLGNDMKVPVNFHQSLSCAPGSTTVGTKHLRLCRKLTYDNIIKMYRPKVIICLGSNALYWATGEEELRINQVRHRPFKRDGRWIISLPHTSMDIHFCAPSRRKGAEDLMEEYLHAFFRATKICKEGTLYVPPNKVTIVTDPEKAMRLPATVSCHSTGYMDTEYGLHDKNPEALTIWHKKSCHIMTSWTFCSLGSGGKHTYTTYVLLGKANCPKVNKAFCSYENSRGKQKRTIKYHNAKADIQIMNIFQFPILKYSDFEDTFHMAGLADQSKMGYGLKPLSKFYFGAEDYDANIKGEIKFMQAMVNRKAWGLYLKSVKSNDRKAELKLLDKYPEMEKYYKRWKTYQDEFPELKITISAKMYIDYRHLDIMELAVYCGSDTYWTARLDVEILSNPEYASYSKVAYDVCKMATRSLSRIEQVGLPLDSYLIKKASEEFKAELHDKEQAFRSLPLVRKAEATGVPYNLKSKLFLKELVRVTGVTTPLTPKTKLPRIKKDEVLPELAAISKFTKEDLVPDNERNSSQKVWAGVYRISELRDLESKFFNSYPKYIINGSIHTNFRILKSEKESTSSYTESKGGGTVTGRLSSANPQTQNIWDIESIRKCFKAPGYSDVGKRMLDEYLDRFPRWDRDFRKRLGTKSWSFVEIDYDRIELVFLAHLCQDERMCAALSKGIDLHDETGRIIFDLIGEVPKAQRDVAKTLNFGLVYGQGIKAFAEQCGISEDKAKEFFRRFHLGYPGINAFYDVVEQRIISGELLETLFGRKRSFRIIGERGFDFGQMRQGKNYLVQSPASDNTVVHVDAVFEWLDARPARHNHIIPVNTVHDSVHFLIDSSKLVACCRHLVNIMTDRKILPFKMELPINCGVKAGSDMWDWKKLEI